MIEAALDIGDDAVQEPQAVSEIVLFQVGTHVFAAGNIKFGLEMRRLPVGDGGLAVHVLADLAGSTENSYV